VAKLLAYADCSLQPMANADPRLCDCNRIINADTIPPGNDQPNKQKEISLKADWKYIGVGSFKMSSLFAANQSPAIGSLSVFLSSQYPEDVFHPPRA